MTDYCTVSDLKSAGRLNITGTDYDTPLGDLVTAASRWVDRYCNIVDNGFAQAATATRYYTGNRIHRAVLLLDMPILSVTTLINGDGNAITNSYYRLHPRNGRYFTEIALLSTYTTGWYFSTEDSEISVLGAWGMFTTTPPPVEEASLILAGWMFKRYQSALTDATANFELGQMQYSESMPKQVQALLAPYRFGNHVGM